MSFRNELTFNTLRHFYSMLCYKVTKNNIIYKIPRLFKQKCQDPYCEVLLQIKWISNFNTTESTQKNHTQVIVNTNIESETMTQRGAKFEAQIHYLLLDCSTVPFSQELVKKYFTDIKLFSSIILEHENGKDIIVCEGRFKGFEAE